MTPPRCLALVCAFRVDRRARLNFDGVTVLCVGDVMLDRFVHGEVERISPEAPIPVLWLTETKEMLGGTGNVAHNVATLGGQAILVGLLGTDDPGAVVQRIVGGIPGIVPAFVLTPRRPTICKTRFVASRQQVVRADQESRLPLQADEERDLVAAVERNLPRAQAVVLSDYGKAVLSRGLLERVIGMARGRGLPVFVDPKSDDFSRYLGATCITPNLKELAQASKMPVATAPEVEAAARAVIAQAQAEAILATRSEHGMMLVRREGETESVGSRAREVFDVSGAGDTVVATLALAHASGLSLVQAMHVANAAAGVVVSKLGTATATVDEVMQELNGGAGEAGAVLPGLQALPAVLALVARWKQQGLKVGFTNGCFDLLHPGHVSLLKAARAQCDRLVVALNTDASVRRLKGPARPVNDLESRSQVIAAIRYVDCTVAFDAETPIELIRGILPDVLVKGADYSVETVVGAEVVQAAGGRVFLADLVPGQSSTAMVGRIDQKHVQPAKATPARKRVSTPTRVPLQTKA